jgi:hypothetical protein
LQASLLWEKKREKSRLPFSLERNFNFLKLKDFYLFSLTKAKSFFSFANIFNNYFDLLCFGTAAQERAQGKCLLT